MLGKRSSFLEIRRLLADLKTVKWTSQNEVLLGRTKRWFVAWSFFPLKLEFSPQTQIRSLGIPLEELLSYLTQELRLTVSSVPEGYRVSIVQNMWSRRARRTGPQNSNEDLLPSPVFVSVLASDNGIILQALPSSMKEQLIIESLFNHLATKFST